MKGNDNIKDLFSEKLGNYEAPVKPELWSGINSQISTTTAQSAAGGMTVLTKTLIGLGIIAATVVTAVIVSSNNEPVEQPSKKKKVVQVDADEKEAAPVTENKEIVEQIEESTQPNTDFETPEVPDVELGYEYIPTAVMPVEEFKERITKEDEPIRELTELPGEQNEPTEDGPIDEKIVTNPGESPSENIPTAEPEVVEVEIVLPNTFTPNNDNRNDFYEIMEGADELQDFSVFIYNMSGEIVFRSDDPNFRWNGQNLMHEVVPEGKYMCVLIATDKAGNPRKITKQFDLFK